MNEQAAAQQKFELLLDSLGVGVVVVGLDGKVQTTNLRAREVLNIPQIWQDDARIHQMDLEVFDEAGKPVSPEDFPVVKTLETGEPFANVVLGVRSPRAGAITWLLVGTHQTRDPETKKATGVICTYVDITEQRATQDSLRASEERFRLFAENAADGIYRVAFEPLRFEYINPAIKSILGYDRDDFYRNPQLVFDLVHPDDVQATRAHLANLEGATDPLVIRMTRRDGEIIHTEHRIVQVVEYGKLVALEGIVRDVTALRAAAADLSHLALHDSLTGLPNRRNLLDQLERALARERRETTALAVLYIDVDRFKVVNDNLGHDVGDRLLGVIGRRVQDALRPSDFVARLGGDEFAAVLLELNGEREATVVADRVLAAVAEPVDLGEGEMVATVSIGVAFADFGRPTAVELLRRADLAMYTAKDRGRAQVALFDRPTSSEPSRIRS
ncbi:MAG: sensor domain-containing diguanylate cyclase [Acidimicrobiia bacterium]